MNSTIPSILQPCISHVTKENVQWVHYHNKIVKVSDYISISLSVAHVIAIVAIVVMLEYKVISFKVGACIMVGIHSFKIVSSIGQIVHTWFFLDQKMKGITWNLFPKEVYGEEETTDSLLLLTRCVLFELSSLVISSLALTHLTVSTTLALFYSTLATTIAAGVMTSIVRHQRPKILENTLDQKTISEKIIEIFNKANIDTMDTKNINTLISRIQIHDTTFLNQSTLCTLIPYLTSSPAVIPDSSNT